MIELELVIMNTSSINDITKTRLDGRFTLNLIVLVNVNLGVLKE